jgi:hypothetical protein
MYGGIAPIVGGGTAGAVLAYTGTNLTGPLILVASTLTLGTLLMIRERVIAKNRSHEEL